LSAEQAITTRRPGLADAVDFIGNRPQPGPAVFIGQGDDRRSILATFAGGVKFVAVPRKSSSAVRPGLSAMVLLPEPATPITTKRAGNVSGVIGHENSPANASLVDEPDGFRQWKRARFRRQVLALQYAGQGSCALSAPLTSNSISRHEPNAGKVQA